MKRFGDILVVCVEQSATEQALDKVAWLAKANEASVTLVDTIDNEPGELARLFSVFSTPEAAEIEEDVIADHRDRLNGIAEGLRAQGLEVKTDVLLGSPFIQVIRKVMRDGHDLVIKGAQRSAAHPVFQSADMHLMRKCPCPVWMLNTPGASQVRHILAAVDPDPDDAVRDKLNHTVMELATSLAQREGAKLDVVNVWRLQEEGALRRSRARLTDAQIQKILDEEQVRSAARLDALMADFTDFQDIARVLHLKGLAEDVIPEHAKAESVDTIVMGTVGRTGVSGFIIGNTAETILNRVSCSVLTVKPVGFESPVTLDG